MSDRPFLRCGCYFCLERLSQQQRHISFELMWSWVQTWCSLMSHLLWLGYRRLMCWRLGLQLMWHCWHWPMEVLTSTTDWSLTKSFFPRSQEVGTGWRTKRHILENMCCPWPFPSLSLPLVHHEVLHWSPSFSTPWCLPHHAQGSEALEPSDHDPELQIYELN